MKTSTSARPATDATSDFCRSSLTQRRADVVLLDDLHGHGQRARVQLVGERRDLLFREAAVDHAVVGDHAFDRRVADPLLVEEDAHDLVHVLARHVGELARVLRHEVDLRFVALSEAGRRALELRAAVHDGTRVLVRAVRIVRVLRIAARALADLRRLDLELEHRGLLEQRLELVGVLDRGHLDEKAIRTLFEITGSETPSAFTRLSTTSSTWFWTSGVIFGTSFVGCSCSSTRAPP